MSNLSLLILQLFLTFLPRGDSIHSNDESGSEGDENEGSEEEEIM